MSKLEAKEETQLAAEDLEVLSTENLKRISPIAADQEPDNLEIEDDLVLVGIMRKLIKNNSQVKGWMNQIFLNTIGTGQKPLFNSSNKEFNKLAKEYYRQKSKNWEGRDSKSRYLCNEITFKTSYGEGEIFAYYDATGVMEKGRWFYWTREYMPNIRKSDFKDKKNQIKKIVGAGKDDRLKQTKGLITNQWGVTKGYIICSEPGLGESRYQPGSEKNKITIIPADHNAKLIKVTDEMNAKHGLSMLVALASEVNDVRRLLKSYVNKAEVQAKIAMLFKVENPFKKQKSRSANQDANADRTPEDTSVRLENFEKMAQNYNAVIEYLKKDETVEFKSLMNGESKEIETVYNAVTCQGGYGLGLARMHSSGSSDKASFAGLMAESTISGRTFQYWQKFIEREIYDFESVAVIKDAIKNKKLPNVEDYDKISWAGWPKSKSLNHLQDIKALKEWLKSGLMPPDEIRGDLLESLKSLAEFKKHAEEQGLKLDIFEYSNSDEEEEVIMPNAGEEEEK